MALDPVSSRGSGGGGLPTGWTADDPLPGSLNAGADGSLIVPFITDNFGTRFGSGLYGQWGDIQSADNPGWGAEFAMPDTDQPAIQTYDEGFNNVVFKWFGHTAPSDSALNAGECGLYFDETNGAAKLRIKAKSANGTVATGAVDLA